MAAVLALALVCFSAAEPLWAHGGGGDVAIFTTPDGGQVDVGFAILDDDDIDHVFFDPDESVFQAVLIPRTPTLLPPIPYAIGTPEPGYDANEQALPPLAVLTSNTLGLWYWDGVGTVDFQPPAGITGGYAPQPGTTFADGGYHAHPTFGLLGSSIPNGIYMAKVSISVSGLADSDPYYLVTLVDDTLYTGDADMDAEHGEAVGEMVRAYLDDPEGAPEPLFNGKNYTFYAHAVSFARSIPEPTAIALFVIALAGVLAGSPRAIRTK